MSRTIEERVVSMHFDNKQFEAAAATSMSTLDRLKEKLNFKGAAKGLSEVSKAADTVSLSGLTKSAEAVEVKFSAMSVVAITAIQRIVNKAADAGAQIAKSLTIEPINTGFNEYELKMSSVQTIMASTGADLQTVTGYLEELNEYADKTIYSFADMTQNIGKFTNAGVKLEDAVKAIQGISNEAAVSGANANEASRAMYNFAQALSAGYVKLIDWKSIELANMATVEFKNQLLETAAALGTVTKASDGTYKTLKGTALSATKNFNETLEQQWLTTDVLIQTLGDYADETTEIGKKAFAAAQDVKTFTQLLDTLKEAAGSGWATTWEIVIGNFEEAKVIWTSASEVIGGMIGRAADERNAMLRDWKALGGRDSMIATFGNAWKALLSVITPVRDAMREIFPPTTGAQLAAMTKAVEKFTAALTLSEEASYTLKVAIKLLLLPLNALVQIAKVGASALATLTLYAWKLLDSFLALPSKTKSLNSAMRKLFGDSRYERAANAVVTITQKVGAGFDFLGEKISSLFAFSRGVGMQNLYSAFEKFSSILAPIGDLILDGIVYGLEKVAEFDFSNLVQFGKSGLQFVNGQLDKFKSLVSSATSVLSGFWSNFSVGADFNPMEAAISLINSAKQSISGFSIGNIVRTVFDVLSEGFDAIGESAKGFIEVLEGVAEKIDPVQLMIFAFGIAMTGVALSTARAASSLAKTMDSVSGTLNGFTGVLTAIQKKILPSKFQQLVYVIAALAGALVILSMVDSARLMQATTSVLMLMGGLTGMVAILALIDRFLVKSDAFAEKMQSVAAGMALMATAVLALSIPVAIFSGLSLGEFITGLGSVVVLMGAITAASIAMSKFAPTLSKNSIFLIMFATSINMVVNSIRKLTDSDLSNVPSAIGELTLIMGLLYGLSIAASRIKFSSAVGVGALALSLMLFIKVLNVLAGVDVGDLIDGIAPLVPVMALIRVLALATSQAAKASAGIGFSIIAMSAAVLLLVQAIKQISGIDTSSAIKATAIISVLFGVFTLVSRFMGTLSGDQKPAKIGKEILLMSGAILLLGVAIDYIGGMDAAKVAKGTLAVVAMLSMFAIIGKVGATAKASLGFIVALTAAVGILSTALALFSMIPIDNLLPATAAITAMLIAFGEAMKLMGKMDLAKPIRTTIMMAVLISGLALALKAIGELDVDNALTSSLALSALILSVSGSTKLMAAMKWTDAITAVKSMGIMLTGAVAALAVLQLFNPDGMIEKAVALSTIIGAVAGATALLNVTSMGAMVAGNASIAMFLKTIGVVTAIVAALGALSQLDGAQKLADDGVEMFAKIGRAIGSFIGELVGSIIGGAQSGYLVTSADSLSKFSEKIKPFLENLKGVDETSVAGAGNLAKILLAMTGATFLDGLAGFISSDLTSVGDDLAAFGPSMKQFISDIASIGTKEIDSAAYATESIAKLFEVMPNIGGLTSVIFGNKNADYFAKSLSGLAEGIVGYMNSISGVSFDTEALDGSVNAAKSLTALLDAMPSTGGKFQEWFGEKSFSAFTKKDFDGQTALAAFANALVEYSNIIVTGNINESMVQKSTSMAQSLAAIVDSLPSTGGAFQEWFGEKDLSGFGTNLVNLADSLVGYSDTLNNASFNPAAFETSISAVKTAVDVLLSLPKTGGLGDVFGGKQSFSNFAIELKNLGSAVEDFGGKVSSLDIETIKASSNTILTLVDGLTGKTEMVRNAGTDIAKAFAEAINDEEESFKLAGSDAVDGLIKGVKKKGSDLNKAVTSVCEGAITAARIAFDEHSPSKVFFKIGEYVTQGLANGIVDNAALANDGVIKMGASMVAAIQGYLGIHSPSTVMRDEVGRYIVQGIAEGITSDMSAEEAAAQKVSNIVNAFKAAVDQIDLSMTTVDLEHQLWGNLEGGTEEETTLKEMEVLRKKLELQSEKVAYANAEYKTMAQQFGETADDTQDAYNRFLQEQITLSELAKSLFDAQESVVVDQRTAIQKYYELYQEYTKIADMMQWTQDQVHKIAAEEAGLDPNTMQVATKAEFQSVQEIFDYYMKDVEVVIKNTVSSGVNKASQTAASGGQQIGSNMANGIANGLNADSGKVIDTASNIVDQVNDKLSGIDFSGSATGILDGLIDGANSKLQELGNAGANLFKSMQEGFNSEAEIHSPSRVMYQSGVYLVEGLAEGINASSHIATDALANIFLMGESDTGETSMPMFMQKVIEGLVSQQDALVKFILDTMDQVFMTATTDRQDLYYQNGYNLSVAMANGIRDGFTTTFDSVMAEVEAMLDRLETSINDRASRMKSTLSSISILGSSGGNITINTSSQSGSRVPNYNPVTSTAMASGVANSMDKDSKPSQDIRTSNSVTNNYAFTQNNYSPSALSRADIYRDTKNQFSAFKEAVAAK